MKWLNGYRTRRVLVGCVAAIVLGVGIAKADFIFGKPTPLEATINSGGHSWFDCISSDGLELYLDKPINGKAMSENWDLYVSKRPTTNDPWSIPVSLGSPVNSSSWESSACLSCDDLELYFVSTRPGGKGGFDLWITNRPTRSDPWDSPKNLGPTINTYFHEDTPWITPDGLELYFSSTRPGGYGEDDIWISQRASRNDPWQTPVNLGPVVNSTKSDAHPCLSPDGLVLFFSDYAYTSGGPFRPGGLGLSDMWMTRRKSIMDPWDPPVNLGPELNSNTQDPQPRLSPDCSILYFTSWRSGGPAYGFNIWQAPIIPIVDLNSDGIVDAADMCIIVDHWGEDYSLCDIGPMPWGDGVVDVEDIKVLAEHLFTYPGAVAYWTLDETEGDIAYDSVGSHNGTLVGGPIWQPDGGIEDGALQFDGVDDYVSTDYVLDPADGKFSVVAWIKGGAPGQVILSQANGSNWLCLDSAESCLITELKAKGFGAGPLLSQTVITNGDWHRIGLVWDGSCRHLYVDGAEVAKDAASLPALASAEGGLYFGAGSTLAPGTFFSGLIDDIRIYNRVVSP